MGILAVAELLELDQIYHEMLREVGVLLSEPVGDGRIVMSRVVKGLGCQTTTGLPRELTLVVLHLLEHDFVVGRIGDDPHSGEVLRR